MEQNTHVFGMEQNTHIVTKMRNGRVNGDADGGHAMERRIRDCHPSVGLPRAGRWRKS